MTSENTVSENNSLLSSSASPYEEYIPGRDFIPMKVYYWCKYCNERFYKLKSAPPYSYTKPLCDSCLYSEHISCIGCSKKAIVDKRERHNRLCTSCQNVRSV